MDIEPYQKSNVGRKPGEIQYTQVEYETKKYIVGTIKFCNNPIDFIFDESDFETVSKFAWHVATKKYISTHYFVWIDDTKERKELYLHNLVMNRNAWNGKGHTESIDHINRNGFDNRKENLRLVSQSYQNINQSKRKRNVVLPGNFPLKPEDIPTHIWYVRANGLHGDRFAIEFKTEGICWKTTSSKSVSIHDKLSQAKEKLNELYQIYPYLNSNSYSNEIQKLNDSFNAIVALAHTPQTTPSSHNDT